MGIDRSAGDGRATGVRFTRRVRSDDHAGSVATFNSPV